MSGELSADALRCLTPESLGLLVALVAIFHDARRRREGDVARAAP